MKKLTLILVSCAVVAGAVVLAKVLSSPGDGTSDSGTTLVAKRNPDPASKDRPRARRIPSRKTSGEARVDETRNREPPKFEIAAADEENLTDIQRKLLEEIREALRLDDYKTLMRLVHKMQTSDEWPDGIPKSIKKAALDALGWYGSKCLPEIVNFLGDADPEIVGEATSQWEDAIAECDSDREVSDQVKLAVRVVSEADSLDSILVETQNMRHSVAVETFKSVLAEGNEKAKEMVLEQIADYTNDATITTAEQLDAWLEQNPDDPGDEEMYGGIEDGDDD